MILRMYELAAADLERLAGWPASAGTYAAPLAISWPRDRLAIELAVASADARGRQLTDAERAVTVRRLIPWMIRRVLEAPAVAGAHATTLVARLDGRLERGGILDAMKHLRVARRGTLFSLTGGSRLSETDPPPCASMAMTVSMDEVASICGDSELAWDGGLRLRIFALPPALAPLVLEGTAPVDERWARLLPDVSLMVLPSANMQSLFVVGPATAEELRDLLTLDPDD